MNGEKHLAARQAVGLGRLDLPGWHGDKATPKHFGRIGRKNDGQGKHAAHERADFESPVEMLIDQVGEPEIADQNDQKFRDASQQAGEKMHGHAQEWQAGQLARGEQQAQHQAKKERGEGELQRDQGALQQLP